MKDVNFKLKAWDKLSLEFKDVRQIHFDTREVIFEDVKGTDLTDWRFLDDVDLLMPTNIKDTEDNEIFEGHIIKGNHPDYFIVDFINGGTQIYNAKYFGQDNNELVSMPTCDLQTRSWLKDSKIVGNIYENKNLLHKI